MAVSMNACCTDKAPVARQDASCAYGRLACALNGYARGVLRALRGAGGFAADVAAIARDPALADDRILAVAQAPGSGPVRTGGRAGRPLARLLRLLEIPLYASFWAMLFYRVAHLLGAARLPLVPRLLSQAARFLTGIEIHPGARIGPGMFIDHGSGVVIGATAIVGRDARLFHGVTLGGVDARPGRRHPFLGDGVTVGCGASVLGPVAVGDGAIVGAQAVVLADVAPGSTVAGVPAAPISRRPAGPRA